MSSAPNVYASDFETEPTQRVSGLAIASLVFGLLCCIPGVGVISLILGTSALIAISRSQGRLSGRGLAVSGLVLGLLGSIYTITIGLVAYQTQAQLHSYGGTYTLVEKQDYSAFRARLSPSSVVSDEQINAFRDRVTGEWGSYVATPKGLGDWVKSYMAVQSGINQTMGQPNPNTRGNIIPVPLKFQQGTALVIFVLDPNRAAGPLPRAIENIVVLDKSDKPIWLKDPGQNNPFLAPGSSGTPLPAPKTDSTPKTDAPETPAETPSEPPAPEPAEGGNPPPQ